MINFLSKVKFPPTVSLSVQITVIYFAVGILWILFSDAAVGLVIRDPSLITKLSIAKGCFYVSLTALMLYWLVRRGTAEIARDIAERKQAEQALQDSEANLNRAQEIAHLGSWHLDIVRNQLTWSDEVYRVFGIPRGTPLDYEAFLHRTHPEDRERVDRAWAAALQGAPYDIEHRILVGDELKWVRKRAAIEFDGQGKAIKGIGTAQDITERKRTEEALRERADLLNLTHDTVFVTDMQGVIKYWNRGAAEHYGWAAEQAAGKVVHDLLKTVFPVPVEETKAEVIRTGRWEGELLHTKKDGTQIVVASRWALQRDERGIPVAILETNNDITERKRVEEKMRQQEMELRQVLDFAPQLVAVFGPDRERLYANPPTLDYFGVTTEEWQRISDPLWFFHPDDRKRVAKDVYTGPGSDVPQEFEARMRRKDGAYRWFLFRDNPLRDAQGRIMRWYLSATDIEDRKRGEEALRRSEAYLAEAQRLSHTGSWAFDVASNKYVYASEECLRIFELGPQETSWPREAVSRLIDPDDWDAVNRNFEKSIREKVDTSSEFRILLPSGTKHIQVIRHPVLNEAADVVQLVGSAIDITERKRAEEALSAERRRFNEVLDALPACVALLSPDYHVPFANRYHQERFGRSNGRRCHEYLFGRSEPCENCETFTALKTGAPHRCEWTGPDGRIYDLSMFPFTDVDGARLSLQMGIDITERKRAEEALRLSERKRRDAQRLEAMGELAGGIAHDFNNILAAILGYGEMALRNARPGSRLRRDLENILTAGERGRALVDRVLTFSRSGVGDRVPVHVEKVVREGLDLLAARLPSGIEVEAKLDAGPATIEGDPTQVHQVIMNLATNAIQAMPDGGKLTVSLKAQRMDAERSATIGTVAAAHYIVLEVSDSGTGIAPEILERIFDPFFTTKEAGVGTGLGLSLVHGIVMEVGGAIDVATSMGSGSVFTVYLPRSGDASQHREEAQSVLPQGNGQRILVVDDEEPLVTLMTETLNELGYAPLGFTSSTAALEAFRANPEDFDAVITDERMPGISGVALIGEVRRMRRSIPIILVSGYVGGMLASRAYNAGADEALKKPLSVQELATSLARVLRRQ